LIKWKQKKPKRAFNASDGIIDKLAAINGIEDIERFSNPPKSELHDPYTLKNIMQAANAILTALRNGHWITIHGDVDFDGAASTAIMYNSLKRHTDKICYIHSERSVGHGIYNSVDDIPKQTKLLIIVDSSSNESATCSKIRDMGIEIVILDHHIVDTHNPNCILVNPMQDGCEYPNKNSSGSLISWRMCQVLDDQLGDDFAEYLVDLAGTGVQSDQCSMLEFENRYVLSAALSNIHNLGMKSILTVMKKNIEKLTSSDVAYSLTPFINAGTRFDKMSWILELLTSEDVERCNKLAKDIKELNDQRKRTQKEVVERLKTIANPDDKAHVFIDDTLGKGFNGLVASSLSGYFQKPTLVLGNSTDKHDEFHGSFRSIGFFDFLEFVGVIPEVLFSGGHPSAGGCGIKKDDLEKFRCSLNKGLRNQKFENVISYDLEIDHDDITEDFIRKVKGLYRVTGKHSNESKFLLKDMYTLSKTVMGDIRDTMKVGLVPASMTWFLDDEDIKDLKPTMVAMMFRTNDEAIEVFPLNKSIDIVGSIDLNEFPRYKPRYHIEKTIQMFLDDYRLSE
jgi:single-stranded-DNA-specific exonuclease